MKTSKKKVIFGIGVITLIIVMIGVSYAWLSTTIFGKKEYVIKAGDLSLVLDETSNGLFIDNSLPIPDNEGLQSEGATFSVINNGKNDICYKLYLDDMELQEGETRVEDKFVKYSLDINNEVGNAKVLTNIGSNPNRILDDANVRAGKKNTYQLRLWFNEEEDGDYAGHVFRGKLRIEALQCKVVLPIMKAYSGNDYHEDKYKSKITSIVTKGNTNIPTTALNITGGKGNYWDESEAGDDSVIAYIEDDGSGNGTYKLTIGGNGGIIAPEYFNSEFSHYSVLEYVDLSYLDTSKVTSMYMMFYDCSSLTKLDLSSFDTSKVTHMGEMFSECSNLTSLDLSNFDTSKVTSMSGMFFGCSNLTSLDLSNFDTSNVTSMSNMFTACSNLTSLDLSNFDTSNVTNMDYMFFNCSNLTSLDVSSFDTSNVTNIDYMFYDCSSLTKLDLSSFDTSKVTNMEQIFDGCSSLTSITVSNLWTLNNDYILLNCGTDHFTVV